MTTRPRFDGIDFWRGFALISIFINHVPDNLFGYLTHRNFGFSDAAELFVFLSGVSVALAYGMRFLDGRVRDSMLGLGRRVFTLYWVQILITLLAIAMLAVSVAVLDDDDLMDDGDRDVMATPLRAIAAIISLGHQLAFFNILPLYIVLLLATPALLALARRDRKLMLLASAGVYVVARVFELNIPTWPVEGEWFFNPFAWQLLFAIGLNVGIGLRDGSHAVNRKLFAACLVFLVGSAFLVTNGLTLLPDLWDSTREALDVTKTNLGLLRLIHFLALAYVVYHSGLTWLLRKTKAVLYEPLRLIGRHSLPVFAAGSVLSAFDQVIMDTYTPALIYSLAIIGAGIVLQYVLARYLALRAGSRGAVAMVPVGALSSSGPSGSR